MYPCDSLQVFWWRYPKTDAPNNDIEEVPVRMQAACTTAEQLKFTTVIFFTRTVQGKLFLGTA